LTLQLLTSCKSKDNIKQMTNNDIWKSESKRLLSYLPPHLLPYLKLRWIKEYRPFIRAWEQNYYQITVWHVEFKLSMRSDRFQILIWVLLLLLRLQSYIKKPLLSPQALRALITN